MPLIEPVIRPPAEADSFLLQITTGCSSNYCSFCGAYLNKAFTIKDKQEIFSDIESGAQYFGDSRRIFLLDGDALALKNRRLVPILEKVNQSFAHLTRIASYANGYNIVIRSQSELLELRNQKLSLIYIGLESGNQAILDACRKRSSADEMIEAVRKAEAANIKSSVIVLLGLGGRKHSKEHVRDTINALNKMQPRYLSFLSLMLIPGTALHKEKKDGTFEELNSKELLREAHDIIQGLELHKTVFRCNHASNYLPLEGRFPKDKKSLLTSIDAALKGNLRLTPEFLRGL